ncbi:MAG: hypothetical protein IID41_07240 [Planctomycetes bacterium]|nr:hypothetical protein [Planctomycetota bacterium]
MTWIEKARAWIDSDDTKEDTPNALATATGLGESLKKPLRVKSGYMAVKNMLALAKHMGINIWELLDDSADWPPPKNRLSDDLALEDPKLARVIDSRVATVLRSAADSVE